MTITIGSVTLNRVTRYRLDFHMDVGIKNIPMIAESGNQIDEDAYSFHRPEYEIEVHVTDGQKEQLERHNEDKTIQSFDDGINTDDIQLSDFRYRHRIGHNRHVVTIKLLGSSV